MTDQHPPLHALAFVAALACCAVVQAQTVQQIDSLPAVTVTGEKTVRDIERTAPSVKVFSSGDLERQPGLTGTRALLENTVNITSSGTQNLAPAVRGIDGTGPSQGRDAFTAGTRSRLNIQVDGRAASFNEITFGELGLWDVDRVEIFRGAQSTLQGRNAIAGTIIYKTNDPSFKPEYGGRLLVGNHGQREVAAVVSGPILADELAFRLALERQGSDSFVKGFAAYPGVDHPGELKGGSARAKLLYKPKDLPGLRTQLTVAHTGYQAPQTEGVARPFGDLRASSDASFANMPRFNPRSTNGVWDTTWELSERLTLENRLASGRYAIRRNAQPGDGIATIDGHDFTLEPRLRYAAANKSWSGFVGLYAFRAKQHDTLDLFDGGDWQDKTATNAIYGEATLAVAPQLDLTLGGRYEREHRVRRGSLAFLVTDFDKRYANFLPKATLAWQADAATTLGLAVSRGYNGGNAGFTYEAPYVNYTYQPEYVWNYEAFVRSRQLNNKLRLTGNVFLNRYKDMQLPFDLSPNPAEWSYIVRNAPRAETYGAELGATWVAARGLEFSGELGLLKAKVTRYADSGVEGHELPRSPRLTATLGVNWQGPQGLELGASARYSSRYYSEITNLDRGRVKPGWIANARAAYPLGQFKLFAYVNNLFDTQRPIQIDADPNAPDDSADVASLPRPRSFGVGVEAWF